MQMLSFIKFLSAAIIGSMLGPYFTHFLSKEKIKQEERLKYLEKAYLLASQIDSYTRQSTTNLMFIIAALKNQISFEKLPTQKDAPFTELLVLFDYHLNAPKELKEQIDTLNNKIILSYHPIAEAINSTHVDEKDKLFFNAVTDCLDTIKSALPIQEQLIQWIKSEKDKVDQKVSIFEKGFWINIKKRCRTLFSCRK
jgi:hypothetical protein